MRLGFRPNTGLVDRVIRGVIGCTLIGVSFLESLAPGWRGLVAVFGFLSIIEALTGY